MPVVVIASLKGGVGKSTCAIILMTHAAQMGIEVTALDCDPNHSLSIWAEAGLLAGITLRSGVGASDVVRTIRAAEGQGKLVVVDLEGVASQIVSRAISQADLVLVPMQATHIDAVVGARSLTLVSEEEEALGRKIRSAVILTKTSTIRSKIHRELEQQVGELGVDLIQPPLLARSAFSELFAHGGNLEGLRKVSTAGNVQAAIDNAQAYTEAVLGRLGLIVGNFPLKSTPKSADTRETDKVAEAHGYLDREPRKKAGRPPSIRQFQLHPKVRPAIGEAFAAEAQELGVTQGQLFEQMWAAYLKTQTSPERARRSRVLPALSGGTKAEVG